MFNKNADGEYDVILAKYDLLKTDLESLTKSELDNTEIEYTSLQGKFGISEPICIDVQEWQYSLEYIPGQGYSYVGDWYTISSYCASESGGGGGDGLGDGIGSSGNTGGGILTSPVDSNHGGGGSSQETFPDTPCGRIQKGTNSDKYKQNFKSLNKQEKFVLPMETGFAQKKTNGVLGYSYLQAPNGASLTVPLGSLNFTHVHNNHIVTIDGDTYDGGVKILSPADVLGLITTCQNASVSANINPNEAFGIMISNEGIFAITLLEPLSLTELGQLNPKWKTLNDEYYEQAGQIITNQNLDANGRKGALQKVLLKFLKNAELENKVGLFEGEVQNEIDSYNINWTKKSLNPTNPSAAPVETPC